MTALSQVYIYENLHTIPLSSILRNGMEAMSNGGYVKISNHTGRNWPIIAYGSAYAVYNQAIPKYYIYAKHHKYNLWQEYNGMYPTERCKAKDNTTLATESNIYQRMDTRMNSPSAFRIMVFNANDKLLSAHERQQINLKA